MPIYTRAGDDGTTSIMGGKRVTKNNPIIRIVGSIDECSSSIGVLRTYLRPSHVEKELETIQRDLYYINASIAGKKIDPDYFDKRVKYIEIMIDEMEIQLPKLDHFILPGGSREGALTHSIRSVCRRTERELVENAHCSKEIFTYINRLSDYFFILARMMNMNSGVREQEAESK